MSSPKLCGSFDELVASQEAPAARRRLKNALDINDASGAERDDVKKTGVEEGKGVKTPKKPKGKCKGKKRKANVPMLSLEAALYL